MTMDKPINNKKWTTRPFIRLSIIALPILITTSLFFFNSSTPTLHVNKERITISTVSHGPFQEYIPVTGIVIPRNTLYIDAVEGGRIEKIFTEAGSFVNPGDKILLLSNPDLQLTLLNNEVQIHRAENELQMNRMQLEQNRLTLEEKRIEADYNKKNLEQRLHRSKILFKEKMISLQEYEDIENTFNYWVKKQNLALQSEKNNLDFLQNQLNQQEISVKQMQNHLQLIRQQQEQLTIRATIPGLLSSLSAEKGQSITPGKRLGQIDQIDGYKIETTIDELYIHDVQTGKTGQFELANHSYSVTVTKVYPEVLNGQFKIDMTFNNPIPTSITRGQTLRIRLQLGSPTQTTLLNRGGFFQASGGRFVFVLDPSGHSATRRPIRIGRQNPEFFEVIQGLQPGDRVITSTYENYRDIVHLAIK